MRVSECGMKVVAVMTYYLVFGTPPTQQKYLHERVAQWRYSRPLFGVYEGVKNTQREYVSK